MPTPPEQPLRVLHYLDAVREEAGGVVRCVIDLCNVLVNHGCEVTLATFDCHDIPEDWSNRDDLKVLDLSGNEQALGTAMGGADVVHFHTPWDRKNARLAKFLRIPNVPYILSVHGMLDDWCMDQKRWKKQLYLWLAGRRLLEQAYRVHCTAEGEAQQASKWYPAGESAVLPLVVDLPDRRTLPGPQLAIDAIPALKTPDAKVLFLSRLHPKKGVDLLLRATAIAMQHRTQFELIIAGPGDAGYVAELKRLAVELGVAERAHFIGLVQGETKLSLYEACDLFVLPTHQENFGLVLPEALACGTPVMTTKGVDIWPEIEAAGGAIIDNQPELLAEVFGSLLSDRDALAQRGKQGSDYVYHWLDPRRVVEGYIKLYREAAASR